MEEEKITPNTAPENTELKDTSIDKDIKSWTLETDPVKQALKKPLLWFYPSAIVKPA